MDPKSIHAQGAFDRTMLASITGINTKKGTVSIVFNDQFGFRDDVVIPVIGMSKDSWIRFMPQVNDVVHVGIRGDDSAVILGWHPWSYKARAGGFDAQDMNQAGGDGPEMMQELQPGEIDMRSNGGGYLRFNKIGDVLMMGLAGKMQIQGQEGITELSQNAIKITDGKSTIRFGQVVRPFDGVNERELPTTGSGQPVNHLTDAREFDIRLYDAAGNLQYQQSHGTVIDESGVAEVSGTSGAPGLNKANVPNSGAAATGFVSGDSKTSLTNLVKNLPSLGDNVIDAVTKQIDSIKNSISTVINGIGGSLDDITDTASDLAGILTGTGPIGEGQLPINGRGAVGNTLRHRTVVGSPDGKMAAMDIDDKGGVVISSESAEGVHINANSGGLHLFAKAGLKLLADGLIAVADNIFSTAKEDIKDVAGGKIHRIAGTDIKDNGMDISRTAQATIADKAGTSITHNSDGSITIEAGSSLSESGATVSISATGTITISGGGIVTITGSIVNIN